MKDRNIRQFMLMEEGGKMRVKQDEYVEVLSIHI
jgi:hypothetical protein